MDPRADAAKRYTYRHEPEPQRDLSSWFGVWSKKKEAPVRVPEVPAPRAPEPARFELTNENCAGLDSSQFSIFFIDGTFDDFRFASPRTAVFRVEQPRSVCNAFLQWLQLDPARDFNKIEAWHKEAVGSSPAELMFFKTPKFGSKFNFPAFDTWMGSLSDPQLASREKYAQTMRSVVETLFPNFQFSSVEDYLSMMPDRESGAMSYAMDLRRAVEYRMSEDRARYPR